MSYIGAAASKATGSVACSVFGGAFGIFSAICGYYLAISGLLQAVSLTLSLFTTIEATMSMIAKVQEMKGNKG